MYTDIITRAALGSSASLGDLYDARRDDFCGISIFKKKIPEEAKTIEDAPFSDMHLVHSDNFSEKFNKLDVSAELSVSVLAGLFTLSGSGKYLSDKKTSARTVKSSLIYNITTKYESVQIYSDGLKDGFAIDAIESGVATHVVVGISWGANSIVSCMYENKDNQDVQKIEGNLSAQLNKMWLSISGKASVDFTEGDNKKDVKFDFRLFGDVLTDEEIPTTFEGALELMKKVPILVGKSNEGQGKPMTYVLFPISLLKHHLNFSIKADATIKTLEEGSLVRVVQFFDEMNAAQQQLNDFHQDTLDFKFCVTPEDRVKISSLKNDMDIQETSLRSELAKLLTEIRSGKNDVSELEALLKRFQLSNVSPQKVSTTLTNWSKITEKINFARALIQSGAKYIGLGSSLDEEILKNFEAKSYVLYFDQQSKSDANRWAGNRQLFFQEMNKNDGGHQYYAVDCDIHANLMIKDCSSCVQVLQSGQILVSDLLAEQEGIGKVPLVRAISGTEPILYKPNKRVPMTIRCTGNNCDPTKAYEWTCKKCLNILDYGFDSHVYCNCGKTPVTCLEFKCTDPMHGIFFERHQESFLLQLVDSLRPFKEMNILILGETGVGKSTWINGFINFLSYKSLKDAEAGELRTLIPSKFTVVGEDFQEILVSTGADKNEVQQVGQSATQEAKVYPFNIGNTTIRLIDTPGIGDTRGIDQDKKNFQNILGTLSNLEELHGICILLKPNNARLDVMFRFCIKELLTYLHRDASKNIMFCFTNSRGTFYRPGDTMPALKSLLLENKGVEISVSRDTVYCYDSEAYRFLAAVKNNPPVHFPNEEKQNFSISWQRSITETVRMLEHIKGMPPHKIKSTLSLNNSRQLVLRLARPLAEISRNIQTNKSIVQDEQKAIEKTNENIEELRKRQMISRTEIEVTKIKYPKTVCSNSACVKVWTITGGTSVTEYITECHEHCYLKGVSADSIGDVGLMKCYAMSNGFCRVGTCKHSYREHLHVYYDSKQVEKQVEDSSVKESLLQNLSAADMKMKMIEAREKEVKEYEQELLQIEQASVKFAYFLKSNAITPYNDAIEQYLEHLIREEEYKAEKSGNRVTLENMKKSRDSYKAQKHLLDKEMEKGGDGGGKAPPGPGDVEKLVQELQKLKHSGQALKNALESVEHTKTVVYAETTMNNNSRARIYQQQQQQQNSKEDGFFAGIYKKMINIFS